MYGSENNNEDKKMKKLSRDKKAIFYLFVSSIFIAVMIVVFLAYKEYSYTDRQKVVETRIRTINDFIRSIDTDSDRVMFISGFRSLIALEDYVARTGKYLNDTEEYFRVAFYNGTVNGSKVDVLINSSYYDYLEKLRVIAGRMGIGIDINVTHIDLYQQTPWLIGVDVTAQINLTDQKGLAKWNFTRIYNTSVSILSIRDPLYSVATIGRVPNTIRVSNITDFVSSDNDTSALMYHVSHSLYLPNPLAPSFLMRFEGNFSSSPDGNGIESFVYILDLITQSVPYNESKSIIDYVLFSNITGYENVTCSVQNITDSYLWFKIDMNHTRAPSPEYIEDLQYTVCT
jgi:hypothetical protein